MLISGLFYGDIMITSTSYTAVNIHDHGNTMTHAQDTFTGTRW